MRYYGLKTDFDVSKREKVVKHLIDLKKDICSYVPEKLTNSNLLIATWNIRDFNSNKFGHGYRLKESFYYIAEILSAFDLIAIQEVNKDMSGLSRVMYILGPDWDFICTDVTEGSGGNMERMAFVYDKRRVSFKKVAGEIVLPKNNPILKGAQFARTPFMVSFQSGWTKFSLCTAHIYFGSDVVADMQRRIDEIDALSAFLRKRADSDLENLILLGDFNIKDHDHATMKALRSNGFNIPSEIENLKLGSNMSRTKFYDQIAFYSKFSQHFKLGQSSKSSGCYDYYKQVFTEDDFPYFRPSVVKIVEKQKADAEADLLKEKAKTPLDNSAVSSLESAVKKFNNKLQDEQKLRSYYFEEWRTFQMSDHLPLWTELVIDHSESYLLSIIENQNGEL